MCSSNVPMSVLDVTWSLRDTGVEVGDGRARPQD